MPRDTAAQLLRPTTTEGVLDIQVKESVMVSQMIAQRGLSRRRDTCYQKLHARILAASTPPHLPVASGERSESGTSCIWFYGPLGLAEPQPEIIATPGFKDHALKDSG